MIEEKLHGENNINYKSGYRIIVTAGSNMAFLDVLLAIADPGDAVYPEAALRAANELCRKHGL